MRVLALLLLMFLGDLAIAQYEIRGAIVIDEEPLIGVSVTLTSVRSGEVRGSATDSNGAFIISGVERGRYNLSATYIGFKPYTQELRVNQNFNLEAIELEEDVYTIDGVEITGTMIQAIQKGDTTVFNAEAFKTLPDADAKDLIAKIPGIVNDNGTWKANGENVSKITVDGKEFFSDDPQAALNALPAEIIDKIEIIDEKSEQSQFSGFDDGNTTKTINIVTKSDKRNGEFGKLYVGYGENERYQAGGNINIFNGNQRISIIGLSNNINEQNFSAEDLLGVTGSSGNNRRRRRSDGDDFTVGSQLGIATTNSIGLNYSNDFTDKVKLSGSYFFNTSQTIAEKSFIQEYFESESAFIDNYEEDNVTDVDNFNHRIRAKLDVKLNDKNSLTFRPSFSFQGNKQNESALSFLTSSGGVTTMSDYLYDSDNSGYNFKNSLLYRHAFDKKGRTISFDLSHGISDKNGNNEQSSEVEEMALVTDVVQSTESNEAESEYGLEIRYTEPLTDKSRLMLDYGYERSDGSIDQSSYDITDLESLIFLPTLSNDANNLEIVNSGGIGYQWRKGKTMFNARMILEHTSIEAEQSIPSLFASDKTYFNVLPNAMFRWEIDERTNLRIGYRPRTSSPSISQLSETIDASNPLQLSKGNIDLEQSYIHGAFARYSKTFTEKNIIFYGYAGLDYSKNFIGDVSYLSGEEVSLYEELGIDERAQLSYDDNLEGYYNFRSFATIGLPVDVIKSKLNFNISERYSVIPSMIDENTNKAKSNVLGVGVNLTSNISENVDFTIGTNTNLGTVKNTLEPDVDNNYINQQFSFKLNVLLPYGIIFRSNSSYELYDGYGDEYDNSYFLSSMSIGKKILKNNRGEISLSVFDLFNQNNAISNDITGTYIENSVSNVLQRYFMVNFKYDLRHFGTPSLSSKPKNDEFRGPPGGGRGEGPPPGR